MTTTAASILGYRDFLERRDGEPDVYRNTLSAREAFFEKIELEPRRSQATFDRELYLRNLRQRHLDPGLDPRLAWLVLTAQSNQAERFGVELGRVYGRGPSEGEDAEFVHIHLQESYHTRVLADVVGIFGLPVPQDPPPALTRWFIKLMVFNPLPERFNLPLVGMAEMMGCVLFRMLRDRGLELFADEPAVVSRIRTLFNEILADELCHVGLIEARLGRTERAVMLWLYRQFAKREAKSSILAGTLGADRVAKAYREPFDLERMVAEFPETAYAF